MKNIIIFAALFLICASCMNIMPRRQPRNAPRDFNQCSIGTCVGLGGNCSSLGAYCLNDNTCTSNAAGTAYSCEPYSPVGTNCSNFNVQCEYQCSNGICQSSSYENSSPGDQCASNSDCYVPYGLPAPFGTCVNGYCYGLFLGAACNYTDECTNGYCSIVSSKCTAYINPGGACNPADDSCFGAASCLNNVCTELQIESAGGNCSLNICGDNLYCGIDYICHPLSAITYSPCTTDANCTNGLYCTCNSNTGANQCSIGTTASAVSTLRAYQAYQSCWQANNCQSNNYVSQCTACISQFCQVNTQLTQLQYSTNQQLIPACIYNDNQNYINTQVQLVRKQLNCPAPSSASTLQTSFVMALLMAVLLL